MATLLVTGATDGIGRETARQLLAKGHRVLVHGRTAARAAAVADALRADAGGVAVPVWGDLSVMPAVADLADAVAATAPELSVLVNNAGVFETSRHETVDGFERTMAVNHLAVFLLTRRLLPVLQAQPHARIVTVASMMHQSGTIDPDDFTLRHRWSGTGAYAASKLANVLFTMELARRLAGGTVSANCLHPGVIGTKLLRNAFAGMGGAGVEQGARTSVYLAVAPEAAGASGGYYVDCRLAAPSRAARDGALAASLWAGTERALTAFLAD